uniref:Uncharacterized protein n=1 Tax=Arundo donax TaxID=35708 RepID=A0A0A9BLE9_ARUDO
MGRGRGRQQARGDDLRPPLGAGRRRGARRRRAVASSVGHGSGGWRRGRA